ncbi:hypothetical protein ACE1CD_15655 [Aerosakkonema sp. BLCC-F183]|uniref:hypothetical protein n=1 Tax=Aerosakkonema sp. BLCC-F183 TaxID=3342834 RepID=UPI0035B8C69E
MKFKRITVTSTQVYLLPIRASKSLDGRSVEEILKEWFEEFPLHQHHATRESYAIGNSQKVLRVEISDGN